MSRYHVCRTEAELQNTLEDMLMNKKLGLNSFKIWQRWDEGLQQTTWVIVGHATDYKKNP